MSSGFRHRKYSKIPIGSLAFEDGLFDVVYHPPGMGLNNPLNYCYMNVVVQCLYGLPEFRGLFLNGAVLNGLRNANTSVSKGITELFGQMSRNTSGLCVSQFRSIFLHHKNFRNYSNDNQQDASEFMISLINHLHEEVDVEGNSPISSLFYSCIKRVFICSKCELEVAVKSEISSTLEIYCSNIRVEKCVEDHFIECHPITVFNNGGCECNVEFRGRCYFEPRSILIINLKGDRNVKFDMVLDMGKYVAASNVQSTKYVVHGVIQHLRNGEGGHYVVYLKLSDKWYLFDDSALSITREEVVMNQSAYSIIYRQTDLCGDLRTYDPLSVFV